MLILFIDLSKAFDYCIREFLLGFLEGCDTDDGRVDLLTSRGLGRSDTTSVVDET